MKTGGEGIVLPYKIKDVGKNYKKMGHKYGLLPVSSA